MKSAYAISIVAALSLTVSMPVFASEYQESGFDAVINGQSVKEHGGKVVEIENQIYVPLRTTFEMLEKDVAYWKDSKRVFVSDRLEPSDSEYAFRQPYHLIASIPQQDIYLYGLQPKGVVVSYCDDTTYIDAAYATPRRTLPDIAYGDYDGDDIQEIAVSFHTDSGVGIERETLHVLTTDGTEPYVFADHVFDSEMLQQLLTSMIETEMQGQAVTFRINGKQERQFQVDLPEAKNIQSIQMGSLLDFQVAKSGIGFSASLGAVYDGVPEGRIFGYVTGEIRFDGEQFTLQSLDIISQEDEADNAVLKDIAQDLLERDLEIEYIFNAGLQGDSDYHYQCWQIQEETGQTYFPAVSDTYHTIADLENLLRSTYSREERIQEFLKRCKEDGENRPYFKEVDGQLYVDMNNGGHGMPIILDLESVQVNQLSPTKANITFDFDEFDYKTKLAKTSMTLVDGKWYLDYGVYEVAETE